MKNLFLLFFALTCIVSTGLSQAKMTSVQVKTKVFRVAEKTNRYRFVPESLSVDTLAKSLFKTDSSYAIRVKSLQVSTLGVAPATATSAGVKGAIVVTATHIYLCTATNVWVRTALTTF